MSECGVACIAMVLNYYGHKVDMNLLRSKFSTSSLGNTLGDLCRLAQKLSLVGRPVRLEMEGLNKLKTPCILHWSLDHYVVLKKVTKSGIHIHDPSTGARFIKFDMVSNLFTGIALELTPTKEFEIKDERRSLKVKHFFGSATGLKRSLLNILLLSFVLQVFSIAAPFYSQVIIDDVLTYQDTNLLNVLFIGFFIILMLETVTTTIRALALNYLSNMISFQMAANVFSHLIRLTGSYFEKRHIGDIISRFSSIFHIKEMLTTGILVGIVDGLMAIVTLIMMFIYSPKLAIVTTLSVLIYLFFKLLTFNKVKGVTEEGIVAKAEENTNFMETIGAIKGIKIFNRETERMSVWQNKYASVINTDIRLNKITSYLDSGYIFIFGLENLLILYFASQIIMDSSLSVGMLFAFIAYKSNFKDRITGLIEKYMEFKMLALHLDRISDIAFQEKEDIDLPKKNIDIKGNFECKSISFSYSSSEPLILEDLSFNVRAGESVVIVGKSGGGKSTLFNIFLGIYKPISGTFFVDGMDISNIGLPTFRSFIAAVSQDDTLLSGTIADNISFFSGNPDQAFIEECAKISAIYDDVMSMPMKFNTLIGNMGSALSGGQKQRVLIARALYKKPQILFLDEATSHLDPDTEIAVSLAIKKLNITKVMIAHRKETIMSADRIFKLGNGSLIEIDHSDHFMH
jgi:ATP-binding cassette subfamily B protein RaxB